ncbi:MAG: transglutaminase domain-containing protein [Chthoniobacterales bacterium]
MKIAIRYQANYIYEEAASFSTHRVRLFPRADLFGRVERIEFQTDASADVQFRRDLFDNITANCFYPEKLSVLPYQLEIDLELKERNPFHFLLESRALRVPFDYLPTEQFVLAPFLKKDPGLKLPTGLRPGAPLPTVEALVTLNRWIFENFDYTRRDEGDAWSAEETLQRKCGACRDFAVLFAEVLRHHGIAARLASGFLWEPPDFDVADRRAEGALHAWVEAYLPGPGWIGLDPTNGILCDHHFITAAVGITPADVSPVDGHYFGKKTIGSHLESALSITPREE